MTEDGRSKFGRDEHGNMEPEAFHEDDVGDPTAAFEALRGTVEDLSSDLRREMTTIRKGVEAAFDQFERQGAPIDYSADLGTMIQQITTVAERLQAVEKSPVLRQGVDHYARALENSGKSLVHAAAQQFQNESRDFQRVARELSEQIQSARVRRQQDWWLVGVGCAGTVLGVLLTLFSPRIFPETIAPWTASIIMAEVPWRAGISLMAFDNQDAWHRVASADQLVEANKEVVTACRQAAAKSGKDQKCTIIVSVGEARSRP